jgi:hypothetical protein
MAMRNGRAIIVLLSLFAFVGTATAKPSDWADVIERPGDRSALPSARDNAPDVVTKAGAKKSTVKAKKERPKKTKAKKASRRGKVKQSRR